jgi:hypothetical protein
MIMRIFKGTGVVETNAQTWKDIEKDRKRWEKEQKKIEKQNAKIAREREKAWRSETIYRGDIYDNRGGVYDSRGSVYDNRRGVYDSRRGVYDNRGSVYDNNRQRPSVSNNLSAGYQQGFMAGQNDRRRGKFNESNVYRGTGSAPYHGDPTSEDYKYRQGYLQGYNDGYYGRNNY